MRKTHSYLKGLAETPARAGGALQRLKQLRSEVQRKPKVAKADVDRQKMEIELARKLEEARTDLKSCDWLIRKFDSRLDPSEIAPISAWKGRYGKRGALKDAESRILRISDIQDAVLRILVTEVGNRRDIYRQPLQG